MKDGKFIVIEGPEGSGKTSVANFLVDYFKNKNQEAFITREPGGTEVGERIRSILLSNNLDINSRSELFLFLASRATFVDDVVKPALEDGKVVIADRFDFSTFAYQGNGRNLPIERVKEANDFAKGDIEPDLYILLLVDVKEGQRRQFKQGKSKDRMENEDYDFHAKVLEGYENIDSSKSNIFKLDTTNMSLDEVIKEIEQEVEKRF